MINGTFFTAQPAPEPTGHRVGLRLADVLDGVSRKVRAGVLLELDLGQIRDDLRGTRVPFLELPPAVTVVDLKLLANGRYAFERAGDFSHRGTVFGSGWADLDELLETIEAETEDSLVDVQDEFEERTEITLGGNVILEPSSESGHRRTMGWFHGPAVRWVQSRREQDFDVVGQNWIYVGTVRADYYFGEVHAFFNRETRVLRNIFECT